MSVLEDCARVGKIKVPKLRPPSALGALLRSRGIRERVSDGSRTKHNRETRFARHARAACVIMSSAIAEFGGF
eukprot:756717-Pyramimonas_sp.AAC.1